MIDVNEIKTGDCLMISKGGGNFKVCFVLFPDIKNNVCIRHEYDIALQHIRIKRYVEDVPSDLKEYTSIPVVAFKKIISLINNATLDAYNYVKTAAEHSTPNPDSDQYLLYHRITGDYLLAPPENEQTKESFCFTVSPGELSKFAGSPSAWMTGGAEKFTISQSTYKNIMFLCSTTITTLICLLKKTLEESGGMNEVILEQ